jgi:2,4-dienoyl-CoA reductase-like NADH-dependent reductase (Old Yellow Enzyme family)
VLARAERATNRTVETREVRVEASSDDPERLTKARTLEAVTGAINARGGHVFYQLMHAGRMNGIVRALARNS